MNPRPTLAILAVPLACLSLAACGGGQAASSASTAAIPHWLGQQLAGRASAVEASLNRNDQCAALTQVTQLERAEATAIVDGHIPAQLQAPLLSSTQTLAGQITCTPKLPKPPGHHHHQKHGDGQGD
ncbi:MAG: hypothetical protein QOG33_365 [Gaiellales bacterium]|jgi:hypothetical protein|nr:hypothetical protein [Gaiellales bacterium]